jgi:hypothetical protein
VLEMITCFASSFFAISEIKFASLSFSTLSRLVEENLIISSAPYSPRVS